MSVLVVVCITWVSRNMTVITLHMLEVMVQLKTAHFMAVVQELGCRCREHLYSNNDVQHIVLKCCQVTRFLVFFIWILIVCSTGGIC